MDNKTDVFLIDIIGQNNVNGVTRCIESIFDNLDDSKYNKFWIRLILSQETSEAYKLYDDQNGRITINCTNDDLLNFSNVYNKLSVYFKDGCILHLHTLNLIDLANIVRSKVRCKIITHLHCIPYKMFINTDIQKYKEFSDRQKDSRCTKCISSHELRAYQDSDLVICVSNNGQNHVKSIYPFANLKVVNNGIQVPKIHIESRHDDKLLFVGHLSDSKGIKLLFEQMVHIKNKVPQIKLYIAGSKPNNIDKYIQEHYPNIQDNIIYLGIIPFSELQYHYSTQTVGVITSISEQCSYQGIEMMMYGLPIVSTDQDGLQEMFENGFNQLTEHIDDKLTINQQEFQNKVSTLLSDNNLRLKLINNSKLKFEQDYNIENMIGKIESQYDDTNVNLNNKPYVSVVIPTYNSQQYIKESIDSIIKQDYQDFEIVIIDDGSTDRTLDIIRSFNDSRIRIVKNKHDYIDSINMGTTCSRGKYIARMDSDDIMELNRLSSQVYILDNNPFITVCGTNIQTFNDSGNLNHSFTIGFIENPILRLLDINFIQNPTHMVRRDFLIDNHIYYKKDYTYAEDYKLWLDVQCNGGKFYIIPEKLLKYRVHDEQLSASKKQEQDKQKIKVKLEVLEIINNNKDKLIS